MQFQRIFWPYIYPFLGWSRIPHVLQVQINALLDSLPDSPSDRAISVHRIARWRLLLLFSPLFAAAGCAIGTHSNSNALVWLGAACVFGAAFVWATFRSYPRSLLLDARGVCFVCGNHEITCPWPLFAVRGEPQSHAMTVLMPVNPDVVNDVVLTRHGVIVERGFDIQADYLRFLESSQLRVINNLEISPQVLGMLLQELSFALTAKGSTGRGRPSHFCGPTVSPELLPAARPEKDHLSVRSKDAFQEITLPRTRLQFPPQCCACGQPTSDQAWIEASEKSLFSRSKLSVYFFIPCCKDCRWSETVRAWLGGILGASAMVAVAAVIAFATLGAPSGNWSSFLFLVGIIALFPMIPALDFGRHFLLRTKATYLRKSECVHFRFRQAGYAKRVRDYFGN